VAAPDHKIRQCIQGQLYFQVGQMEGPKGMGGTCAEAPRGGVSEGHRSPPIRKFGGYAPEKFPKINFEIAYFLHFCKLKWSHLQCWYARLSIRQVYKLKASVEEAVNRD